MDLIDSFQSPPSPPKIAESLSVAGGKAGSPNVAEVFRLRESDTVVMTAFASPTDGEISWSRVAERRLNASVLFNRSTVAPRRRIECLASVRGLMAHGYHRCLAPRDWEKMSKLRSAELELCAPAHAGRPNQTGG